MIENLGLSPLANGYVDAFVNRALVVPHKAERVYNYHHATLYALTELLAAAGLVASVACRPVREAIIDTQSPRVACVGGSHRCNASAPEVCSAAGACKVALGEACAQGLCGPGLRCDAGSCRAEEPLLIVQRTAQALGLPLTSLEIELGPSQVEAVFAAQDALAAADAMVLFRHATRQALRRAGYHASFMCRPPFPNIMSSGWHLHQSLKDRATHANAFMDANEPLSTIGRHYMAGLLEHARAAAAFSTPTLNGYKRYRPFSLAPDRAIWGRDNRGVMVRLLGGPGDPATHLENRVGEPAANPYLYMASQIVCGLDGLDRKLDPGPSADTPYEAKAPLLPRSLGLTLLCGALAAGLGFTLALLRRRAPGRDAIAALVLLPLAVPPVVYGALMLPAGRLLGLAPGSALTLLGLLPMRVALAYAGAVLAVAAVQPEVIDGARDLGAGAGQRLVRVWWPLLAPAGLALALVGFAHALAEGSVPAFTAGPGGSILAVGMAIVARGGEVDVVPRWALGLSLAPVAVVMISAWAWRPIAASRRRARGP